MSTLRTPGYNLLIDIGNTFLKWGLFRTPSPGGARENRLESGHVLLTELPALTTQFSKFRVPAQIVISNVAGTRIRATMLRMLEVWPDAPVPYWVIPDTQQCGVTNRYRNPAQLGSDRWAALIGARHLTGSRPTLVVVCGTATTIDFMDAEGVFQGGVILPGVGLMLRALHQHTAALPDADGEYSDNPTQTVDAIASGVPARRRRAPSNPRVFNLQTGARHADLTCVLSGGAARALGPRLGIPFTLHDNIVLEGLYRISQSLIPA